MLLLRAGAPIFEAIPSKYLPSFAKKVMHWGTVLTDFGWMKRHSFEIQFWGYETGNIIASITGAGGMKAFFGSLADAYRTGGGPPARSNPVACAGNPGGLCHARSDCDRGDRLSSRERSARRFGQVAADVINALAVPLALGLLGYALISNANLFTVAACAFVVGSCLLRGAANFPLLLKLGGLALSLGGLALAGAGVMVLAVQLFGPGGTGLALSASTFLSGVFVAGAGLLTYQGGAMPLTPLAGPRRWGPRRAVFSPRCFPRPAHSQTGWHGTSIPPFAGASAGLSILACSGFQRT